MKLKIKKLHPDAVMPFKNYNSDFCYDVVATSRQEIAPNVWKYGIGWGFQIDREPNKKVGLRTIYTDVEKHFRNELNLNIDLRPRSSIYKTGLVLSNSIGTIDELYTGEVCAVFYRVIPDLKIYDIGDRIGQIKIGATIPIEFEEVEELSPTDRGSGGYGSTGK